MADPALDAVSIARLHGEACWDCGAVNTTLHPDGTVTTAAGQEWEIRRCISHRTLSEQQERGQACVHCGIILDNRLAIDLGARTSNRGGVAVSWFPRACPPHGALP
jgi:hypothetical protein